MAWFYLIIAAIFEVGWPLGFKLSGLHPEKFWTYITLASLSMLLSGVFLYFALMIFVGIVGLEITSK